MASKNSLIKDAQAVVEELLYLLNIEATVASDISKDSDDPVIIIDIETPDSGLLIGSHGATVNAIQSFVALSLRQKTGDWNTVTVDVGGWRKRHEDYLRNLAQQAAERAKNTGEAQPLYNLTPAQRRIVHVYLAEESGIQTESQGEGEARYLVVKSK